MVHFRGENEKKNEMIALRAKRAKNFSLFNKKVLIFNKNLQNFFSRGGGHGTMAPPLGTLVGRGDGKRKITC